MINKIVLELMYWQIGILFRMLNSTFEDIEDYHKNVDYLFFDVKFNEIRNYISNILMRK